MWKSKPTILIAEDDENDARLLQRTVEKVGIKIPIQIVRDGEEAIRYLEGEGKFADRETYPFPTVVMTDIKMPRLNGFDVLQWLKRHPECSIIPAIVWSSSMQESDVLKAYQLGANCYLKKPTDFKAWEQTVELLFKFWSACETPPLNLRSCSQARNPPGSS